MGRPHVRVAAYVGDRGWGESGVAIAGLLAGLDDRGHAVRLYCSDRDVKGRVSARGLLARRQELGSLAVHHAFRFAAELRLRQPDVLILTTLRSAWAGGLAARRAAVPRVVAWVGLESDRPRGRACRYALRSWVDTAVFPTETMRRRFLDDVPGFTGDAVTILPGVAAASLRGGAALRATLGVPLGAPLLGAIGRLVERKRFDRIIAVLGALPDAHALVVGEGPARRALERAARQAGVADRLHLPGHQDDPGPALDAMDVFVVTSDAEGSGLAMLGALAAGVPVVSTPVAGAREALAPGSGPAPGVVSRFEADSMAGTLRTLLPDRRRLREMGEAGSRAARERYGTARMLDAWEALLAGSIGGAA